MWGLLLLGAKPRLAINAREAVELFRSGMSDVELMKRYNISARSLERLFKKLVDEGEITKSELHSRMYRSGRSHVVDVVSEPVAQAHRIRTNKVRISAEDVVKSLKSGMSDIDLMNEYNLSARGIDRLLRRLVKRGDIAREELERRKKSFYWADLAFVPSDGRSVEPLNEEDLDGVPDEAGFREFIEVHKVGIAACLGALGGVLATIAFSLCVAGMDTTRSLIFGTGAPQSLAGHSVDPLDNATQQVIFALESIARGDRISEKVGTDARSSEYTKCLSDCDREFPGTNPEDRVLWLNCRKGCVVRYSKRMQELRNLYHGARRRR